MSFKSNLDTLVLGVLQDGELHGYEISRRIKQISPSLQIWEGQLYPALHKLELDGYLSATWLNQEGKPARKLYRLTERGVGLLADQRKDWTEFSKAVESVIRPRGLGVAGATGSGAK
jgi:DNA-binding PadR family transcriptional regulator